MYTIHVLVVVAIVVLLQCLLSSGNHITQISLRSSSGVGTNCPGQRVTYICVARSGFRLQWDVTLPNDVRNGNNVIFIGGNSQDIERFRVLDTTFEARVEISQQLLMSGIIARESTLSFTLSNQLNQARVRCSQLDIWNQITDSDSRRITITDPPSTPSNFRRTPVISSLTDTDSTEVNLEWDFEISNTPVDNYTVSTIPATEITTTSNTSVSITLPNNNNKYVVRLVATNCAGNSVPAEIMVLTDPVTTTLRADHMTTADPLTTTPGVDHMTTTPGVDHMTTTPGADHLNTIGPNTTAIESNGTGSLNVSVLIIAIVSFLGLQVLAAVVLVIVAVKCKQRKKAAMNKAESTSATALDLGYSDIDLVNNTAYQSLDDSFRENIIYENPDSLDHGPRYTSVADHYTTIDAETPIYLKLQ